MGDLDNNTGLYYFGARYYNGSVGQWWVPDPLGQYWSPYTYVGNRPLNFVDPHGEFGFFTMVGVLFANWVAGNVVKGFNKAFGGIPSNVPLGGFSSNPYGVTDNFPPFLGFNFQDGAKVSLVFKIDLAELERERLRRLARLRAGLWGMSVALSGGGRYGPVGLPPYSGLGFGSSGRPDNVAFNQLYLGYTVAGTLTGAFGSIAADISAGKLIATHDGILRRNTGLYRVHRGYTAQYLRNSRILGGIGLAIGVGLYGLDLYYAQTRYEYALATARFLGSAVFGFLGGLGGSALLPGYGTFIGAAGGAALGGKIAEALINLYFPPSERY